MRCLLPRLILGAMILGALPMAANAATTTFGPTAYLKHGDTPDGFACEKCILKIEDFEDTALDPFLSIDNGMVIGPDFRSGTSEPITDSVDGDDGSIDGFGLEGHSWFTGEVRDVTITFSSNVKSAGLVFTDGDPDSDNIKIEAFDSGGASLGVIDAGDLADGTFTGETAEDRFLGFQDMDGAIAKITLTMDAGTGIEIDHIHWQDLASCVPEPASAGMTLMALAGLCGFRRRRR